MDHTLNNRSKISFAYTKSSTTGTSTPSTSVAAAAPEPSTLAVKLSETPEGHAHSGDHEVDNDNKHPYRDDQRSLKDVDHDQQEHSPTIRRSRSGRPLRSTVQYDERSSRSHSPENSAEPQGSYTRRTRSSYHGQPNQSEGDGHFPPSEQNSRGATPGTSSRDKQDSPEHNDNGNDSSSRPDHDVHREDQYGDNHDELASDDDQEEEGFGDEGDDANNEGSESVGTSSSKNDDGAESLVVSMYGSPSLVKVRSMFIDKLYKMVEDPAIQHLISWAKEGDMFYVYNCIELSSSILPKFFKHNNWQSFVRQLNMYGFHKIYRYDREESNMNRKNPETQRWQFYHPDFQRDQPHLRNNIKRKSARSVNIAPTFSRVVFERDKGFYMQQESPIRPFNSQGSHVRSHSSNHPQDQSRHSQMYGGHPPGSLPHHYSSHPSSAHRSPHDVSQRPQPIRPVSDYRPPSGLHPNELAHVRDEKDLAASKHHMHPSHLQQPRRDHEIHHHGQHHYQGSPYHQPPQSPYGGPHQRQHSYAGNSQAHYSPEQGYSHKAQGYGSPRPPHEAPQAHSMGGPRSGSQGHVHVTNREPGYPEHSLDVKHGAVMSGGHLRSQSAPGLDPRRGDVSRGPHPFSQHESTRSPPPHPSSQPYYSRDQHGSHPAPSHRHQGSFDEMTQKPAVGPESGITTGDGPSPPHRNSLPKHSMSPMEHPQSHPGAAGHSQHTYSEQHRRNPSLIGGPGDQEEGGRRFTPPPQQQQHSSSTPSHQSQYQPPVDSSLPSESLPTTPGVNPNANPNPHDLIPRVKTLESRLQFVEEAYMSLRQYVQELHNIQGSQDHTIAWMRDRIDQLTEAGTPRDVITSPPLSQAGVVPSKRKAEYSPGEHRDWSRRAPLEHQQQGYSRQGVSPSGPPPSSPSQPPPALPGQGPNIGSQGPIGRYEPSGFHQSFHPGHHSSQASPHTPAPSQHQQPPQQRQHPSPSMNANNHYQKSSIANLHHE